MKKTQRKTQIGFCKHILVLLFLCFTTFTYAQGQAKTVSGVVKDEANEPLVGVGIQLKGTTQGTSTDAKGAFTLRNVQPENVLVVNSVGYISQELKVGSREAFNVVLVEDIKVLGEVVVVGYGTAKKEDLTGAISSVTGDALAREQPASVQDMLRTNIAGLNMAATASPKGNTIDMQIRGRNSLRNKAGTELNPTSNPEMPLLVLDGVIYFGQLTDINPDDIERIDVLKDASSAAVYGAQGSNGVIIITTKKGKEGKPVIKFSAKMGAWFRNNTEQTYKANDYLNMRKDVMKANYLFKSAEGFFDDPSGLSNEDLQDWMALGGGVVAAASPQDVWLTRLRFSEIEKRNYLAGRSYDWEEMMFQTGFSQDYSVSVSGKSQNTSYYTSLNYLDNQGTTRGDDYSTIRARLNLESKLTSFLTFGINTQFAARDEGGSPVGTTVGGLSPYGDLYKLDGTYTLFPNSSLLATNPFLQSTYREHRNDINNLDSRLFIKVDLPFGFSVQSTYAPRFEWSHVEDHRSSEHPQWGTTGYTGDGAFPYTLKRENTKDFRWQFDNLLKWNKEFGKHAFDFTFLMNWEKRQYWKDTILGQNIQPSDLLGTGGMGWATAFKGDASDLASTGDAIMARMHYVYDKRYMLTATFRRDGYSAFGKENPRGNFPSVAVGWIFSEESFFPKTKWMDYGKLRASWGRNGNREIGGAYVALMTLSASNYDYIPLGGGATLSSSAYWPARMANHGLKWEAAESYNFGLDFSIIDSKIRGSFDYYTKETKDLVSSRTLGHVTGYPSITSNMGLVKNTGIELTLSSRNIETDKFTWETSFSLDHNTNKIKKLFGVKDSSGKEVDDIANTWFLGQSIDAIWDYNVLGVWQLGEEEEAAKYTMTPGDFKLEDRGGGENGAIDYKYSNVDKVFIGTKVPKVNISLRNSFTFLKDFSFSFNIYGSFGHHKKYDIVKNTALATDVAMTVRKYWTPENPTNRYSKLGSKNSVAFSVWRRADFIRFDNVSLGYSLPRDLVRKVSLQSVNVNATLRNLGDISSYPGPGLLALPRILTFGLNVTL